MKPYKIRIDDVLQVNPASKWQRLAWKEKSPFEWFKETDEIIKKYKLHCILAVLSEGIDEYPKWVSYIKRRKKRYQIELHGSSHKNYLKLTEEELEQDLIEARDKIEKTFKTKITTWYVPWGRKQQNLYGKKICRKLRLKYGVPKGRQDILTYLWVKKYRPNHRFTSNEFNIHFWSAKEISKLEEFIKTWK